MALTLCMLATAALLPTHLTAQCTGPIQSSVQTYSMTTGGNAPTAIPFTQYNPPANYQLVSAVFNSNITVNANVILTNNGTSDMNPIQLSILAEDLFQIHGAELDDNDGDNLSDNTISKNNVLPGAGVDIPVGDSYTYAPGTAPINNKNMFYDSLITTDNALTEFVGNGSLNMYYTSYPGYSVRGGAPNVTPTFTITNNLTLTYYYCFTGVLAADILNFTAVKNGGEVDLAWITANETPGRTYTVQMSQGDGTDFNDLSTINAAGSGTESTYNSTYQIKPLDKGQLYFRLKMVDLGGATAYSPMRIVNLSTGNTSTDFAIYPNPPTDFIQVTLPGDTHPWQIDILSADGNMVQRNSFNNTQTAQINFNRKLAAGTYFVRAVNTTSGEQHTGSFIIRQ